MGYTLTTKSQVTLPKQIRDHLKVAPGDSVEFRVMADGSVRIEPVRIRKDQRAGKPSAKSLARFQKLVGTAPTAYTTDELMGMLRGYDDDANDPGFADSVPAAAKPADR